MPRYGQYIKGDKTKVVINGEVTELYYNNHLIASADPYGLIIFPYSRTITKATYRSRLIEFLQEFYPKQTEVSINLGNCINIESGYRGLAYVGTRVPQTIELPKPSLDADEQKFSSN